MSTTENEEYEKACGSRWKRMQADGSVCKQTQSQSTPYANGYYHMEKTLPVVYIQETVPKSNF
ncbi:unnamed protein product [Arabis nemorensis]|uniref:Uncharacterized protein n=1 Tax=Arabis nemorensis TaxID=586526 RepID=A0A565C6L0_9BRAS|nr:unnamed protein product [Arabis nemorensis]